MVDLLITNGTVVTMNERRAVFENGAVAVDGRRIHAVGPTPELTDEFEARTEIDASGHAVIPGLISSHVHVSDILVRGGIGTDRDLFDWVFNVKTPAVSEMDPDEHEIAAALYCQEALQAGVTTFVENAMGSGSGFPRDVIDAKLSAYDRAGIRSVYGHAFMDRDIAGEFRTLIERATSREPEVAHVPPEEMVAELDEALGTTETLIDEYHGSAEGRQSVWIAPLLTWAVSPDGLRAAYALAEEHDVMTTTHVSETTYEERQYTSSVEHLRNVGYLGERTLLGHCTHLDERDVRILAETDTRVAHNPLTNMALGSGVAPVPTMIDYGVTVGLGTDNASGSDTVNLLNDVRFAAMQQKALRRDPEAMTAETVLEMATIDGARAIGRADDLGSLEAGKLADVVLVDLDHPHLTPRPDVVSALVYQAQGFEVDTVVCNGEVVVEARRVPGIEANYPDLCEAATRASRDVVRRTGLDSLLEDEWGVPDERD